MSKSQALAAMVHELRANAKGAVCYDDSTTDDDIKLVISKAFKLNHDLVCISNGVVMLLHRGMPSPTGEKRSTWDVEVKNGEVSFTMGRTFHDEFKATADFLLRTHRARGE